MYDATEGETLTELGHMPLNCLIFQDDIDTLAQKKLKSNLTMT